MFIDYDIQDEHPEAFEVYDSFKSEAESVLFLFDFSSYFNLTIKNSSAEKLEGLRASYKSIKKERVWQYWRSWALSENPSKGLLFLKDTKWLDLFPELFGLIGVSQDPERHPEGDVFTHTFLCVDQAASISRRENLSEDDTVLLVFGALCHDLGKQIDTKGHEKLGIPLADRFLRGIGAPDELIRKVKILVENHMADYIVNGRIVEYSTINERFVERLKEKIFPIPLKILSYVHEADISGRDGSKNFSEFNKNFQKILSIDSDNLATFTGRDLAILLSEEIVPGTLAFHGIHQDIFIENVNNAFRKNTLKKDEIRTLLGYIFIGTYRDAVIYTRNLDYRNTKKLLNYINDNDVDLDSLLLKGKPYIENILNTPLE